MAYVALVSVAQMLIEDVLPHHRDYSRLCKKEQMETLQSNVVFLQKLLEQCQGYRRSMVSQLESRITYVAYQVEDIIRSHISDRTTCATLLFEYDSILFHIRQMFSKFGSCIEDSRSGDGETTFSAFRICTQEVNSIVEDAREIKKIVEMKKDVVVGRDSRTAGPLTIGAPGDRDTRKVGLDQDLIQMKERLTGRNPRLEIIPIVGMGGIGKTTLARTVYEDPLTVAHFDFRFWVTVSQEHQAQKILHEILSAVGEASNEDVGSLIERVYKKLIGRRFLIVMDDMWSAEAWDSVRNAFPDEGKSSRVILTTRLSEVAVNVDSSSRLHQMQLLNEDQSWSLFRKEAFGQKNGYPELEKTGKIIVRNCRGLPLAIVVTAGILKLNHTQDYWETLAKSINSAAAAAREDELFRILSLSYDNLLPHLKACFLYMSMFPEDLEIPSTRLIRLWVAEGFLKPKRDKNMEEAAEEYLVDLVERNLIFVSKKKCNGRIKTCTIHDVLRELSLKKAKEENFFQHFRRTYAGKTNSTIVYPRRLSINANAIVSSLQRDLTSTPVHSLIIHNRCTRMLCVEKFRLLRVLDALSISFGTEINELFSLFHLRYLCITIQSDSNRTNLKVLIKLKNLETLIVEHVDTINEFEYPFFLLFPILQLPKLRHFVLSGRHSRNSWYYGIDELGKSRSVLNSLQTLSGITNIKFTAAAIKSFENLIKLKVQYSDVNPKVWERFCLNNLVLLQQLEELSLLLYHHYTLSPIPLPKDIAFPPKLKKLSMSSCKISWEQMSVIGSLPNLEVLKLVKCWFESGEWEPVDGEFQQLKYLKLEIYYLEEWRVESFHFPCLEQLIICRCAELKELPTSVGEIETLKKLVIKFCKERIRDSARKLQKEQESYGNIELEVLVEEIKKRGRN